MGQNERIDLTDQMRFAAELLGDDLDTGVSLGQLLDVGLEFVELLESSPAPCLDDVYDWVTAHTAKLQSGLGACEVEFGRTISGRAGRVWRGPETDVLPGDRSALRLRDLAAAYEAILRAGRYTRASHLMAVPDSIMRRAIDDLVGAVKPIKDACLYACSFYLFHSLVVSREKPTEEDLGTIASQWLGRDDGAVRAVVAQAVPNWRLAWGRGKSRRGRTAKAAADARRLLRMAEDDLEANIRQGLVLSPAEPDVWLQAERMSPHAPFSTYPLTYAQRWARARLRQRSPADAEHLDGTAVESGLSAARGSATYEEHRLRYGRAVREQWKQESDDGHVPLRADEPGLSRGVQEEPPCPWLERLCDVLDAMESCVQCRLRPADRALAADLASAHAQGYSYASKKGMSLRQFFGADYESKRRRLSRLTKKAVVHAQQHRQAPVEGQDDYDELLAEVFGSV